MFLNLLAYHPKSQLKNRNLITLNVEDGRSLTQSQRNLENSPWGDCRGLMHASTLTETTNKISRMHIASTWIITYITAFKRQLSKRFGGASSFKD